MKETLRTRGSVTRASPRLPPGPVRTDSTPSGSPASVKQRARASAVSNVVLVFVIDIVMQTPARFSAAVKTALEHDLPSLRPAVVRSRFEFREKGHPREIASVLDTIARRGSRGVILKAPEAPEVNTAVLRLAEAGIRGRHAGH